MDFLYKPTTNSRQYSSYTRSFNKIKWIVIHATSNPGRGANALNHWRYLNRATRYGSAHYYVDDEMVLQTIGDSRIAWSVGDNQGYGRALNGCNNDNSLSIEMCMNSDADQDKIYKATVELTKALMKKFKVDVDHVCRHYDVSRKSCPIIFKSNNWEKWWKFKEDIKKAPEWEIDLSQSSKIKEYKMKKQPITRFESRNGLDMIITKPENIYQQHIGKNIRSTGAYGINGTFFDTTRPEDPESIYQISINNGRALSGNAQFNSYQGIKKGAFIIDKKGNVHVERLSSIKGFKKGEIDFAVGGVELLPTYDPNKERTFKDILRYTWHTAIGYKSFTDELYLITTNKKCSMYDFKEAIRLQGIDKAVALDGGGSTQMFYKGRGIHQTRRVATIIGLRKISKGGIGNES